MKKWTSFAIGFCFCALVFGALAWQVNTSSGITATEEYSQKVKNGLAELELPKRNDKSSVNAAPQRISNFIHHRSGVKISASNKNILRSAEQDAWDNSKRVDASALTQILTDIALERISATSDSEVTGITDSLRGFNAPGLPEGLQKSRSMVKLRASGMSRMPADEFNLELTKIRDSGTPNIVTKNLIYISLASEVNRRVNVIRDADPQFFGGTQSRMTPSQALLVAYAVIADDPLFGEADLAQQMQKKQEVSSRAARKDFPSPNGHKAYGDNGYLYSSPTGILFNDASVERLITLIQERGN